MGLVAIGKEKHRAVLSHETPLVCRHTDERERERDICSHISYIPCALKAQIFSKKTKLTKFCSNLHGAYSRYLCCCKAVYRVYFYANVNANI